MNIRLGLTLMFFINLSCAMLSHKNMEIGSAEFIKINIGDSENQIEKKLGSPKILSVEKFSSKEYRVFEYSTERKKPNFFFSIDPMTKKVSGRSLWIYEEPERNFDFLIKNHFQINHFKPFYPCHSYGREIVHIDRENGVTIVTRNEKVDLISWSDQALTNLRIAQFFEKCPQGQEKNK